MHKAQAKHSSPARLVPDKLFYKIGEVSRITAVEPYVLRYWESEFPFLRPRKSKSGQRVYVKKDLETILQIKSLLYDERYTIEGVRKRLGEGLRLVEEGHGPVEGIRPATEGLGPVQDPAPLASQQAPEKPQENTPSHAVEHIRKRLREILSRLT